MVVRIASIVRLRQLNEAMLTKLFSKKGEKDTFIPTGRRIYAIGDVHGCLSHLKALLHNITEDDASRTLSESTFAENEAPPLKEKRLIFLGDYVDRGPDSKGVIEELVTLQKRSPGNVFLKGNHEAALLDFIANPQRHGEWLHWGGAETLESYGLTHVWSREETDLAAEFSRKIPTTHRAFLESLELMHIEGDYVFVHAGLKPGVALEEQDASDLMWIRSEFHQTPSEKRPERTVVHGHHPVKKPDDEGWRINVDTGAYSTGKLTAVVLEGASRRFLST